jgi:WD40 repeat protein
MFISPEFNYCVSGSKDGTIYLRNLDKLIEKKEIKAHNLVDNGVSALEFSNKNKVVYSGGFDGSFFVWNLETGQIKYQDLPNSSSNDVL